MKLVRMEEKYRILKFINFPHDSFFFESLLERSF